MNERITWWRCPKCYGTGRTIVAGHADHCFECDGTGNGLIDGRRRAHASRLREIDEEEALHRAEGKS